jgi:hypothetical protein
MDNLPSLGALGDASSGSKGGMDLWLASIMAVCLLLANY